jgi:hypothetical protein
MQRSLAAAALAAVCFTMAGPRVAGAQGPSACPAPTLLKDVPYVRVREGDQASVKVTGHKKPVPSASPSSVPTKAPTVLWVVPPGVRSVSATTTSNESFTVSMPRSAAPNGFVISALPPSVPPSASPSPSPVTPPTALPNGSTGSGAATLSAELKDTYVASIATAAPTTAPNPAGEDVPSVTYTLKGEHSGNTRLVVSQGTDCVAVDVLVRPSKDRFTVTTGVGWSSVPKHGFTTVMVTPPPAPAPPATPLPTPNPAPGTYVYETESSGHQASLPFVGSYRLTDAPNANFYASFGFFANDKNGPLYGISFGSREVLLTVGWHSQSVDLLSPNVNTKTHLLEANGAAATAPLPTTVSSRTTKPFFSLTVPLSLFTSVISQIK